MIHSDQRAANRFCYPLLGRWLELCKRTGAKGNAEYHEKLYHCLVYYYKAPGRHYHTLEHIKGCLSKFDEIKHLLKELDVVELAIWFHDAIYEFWTKPNENEQFSASLAIFFIEHLMDIPHERQLGSRVAYLIENTQYFREGMPFEKTSDAKYFVDLDLYYGWGGDMNDFRGKSELVAKEFEWVESDMYKRERVKVLGSFLVRSPFYLTDYFRDRYEEQTKANLERTIQELEEQSLCQRHRPNKGAIFNNNLKLAVQNKCA